jgi:hypothetical protein
MRMLVIKQNTDVQALSDQLLKAKISSAQSESALTQLQALNPHVDLTKLSAGTVLLVPDLPSIKITPTDPVHGQAFADFQKLVGNSLDEAVTSLRVDSRDRAAERSDVTAALKVTAVTRAIGSDATLKAQAAAVSKTFAQDQQLDKDTVSAAASASKDALATLAKLSKLLS